MADEDEKGKEEQGKTEIDADELKRLKAKAADMDKYKSKVTALQGELDEAKEGVNDLKAKIEKLEKAKPEDGPDVKAQVEEAVAETTKALKKEHEKALTAQKRELTVRFNAERELLAAGSKAEFVRMLDLSEMTEESVKDKVAEFLKEHPEIVAKKDPQPPTPSSVGPKGEMGPDGKPTAKASEATKNLFEEMDKEGLRFGS